MTSSEQNASALHETVPDLQNEAQTCAQTSTPAAQPRSGPVLYELIDKDGKVIGTDSSAAFLADMAKIKWPDQEQDPDRTGAGWDVQVVGLK